MLRYVAVIALLQSGAALQAQAVGDPWRIVRTIHRTDAPDVLVFANGRRLMPPLNGVRLVGRLPRPGAPMLVLSGMSCHDCDDMRNIYFFPADAGTIADVPPYRHYPGRITSGEDEQPYAIERLFIGQCGADSVTSVVRHSRFRDTTGVWQERIARAQVVGDSIVELSSRSSAKELADVLASVKAKRCREIPGLDQTEW